MLSPQAETAIVPPLTTSQPLESMPSPSPVVPSTSMFSVPPLMVVTEGYHYHTVAAAREELLDGIEYALKARGFLLDK